jgi:hypothetical protein
MWAIQASIVAFHGHELTAGGRHLPTFYLSENVQGITDESHAVKVARSILDPYSLTQEQDIVITAVRMPS